MSNFEITQDQLDRFNALEGALDLMDADPETSYTKDQILATVEGLIEMYREERAESERVEEKYSDRYTEPVQNASNRELLEELDRLEMSTFSGTQPLDRLATVRHAAIKAELNVRRADHRI